MNAGREALGSSDLKVRIVPHQEIIDPRDAEESFMPWDDQVREHTRPFIVRGLEASAIGALALIAVNEVPGLEHTPLESIGTGVGAILALGGLIAVWHGIRVRRTANGQYRT